MGGGAGGTLQAMETLVLVRHGATSWNESGYCQGHKDVRLSATGRKQVAHLRMELEDYRFDRAFASPLTRAIETAQGLGHEPTIVEDLIEIDRGHWEGHEPEEIRRRWGKLVKQWYDDPSGLVLPGGEAFDDLWERAGRMLARWESEEAETVVACAHKAINRVIIARATGRPTKGVWDIPQPQASYSVLHYEPARSGRAAAGGKWTAETVGDVEHLPSGMRSDS